MSPLRQYARWDVQRGPSSSQVVDRVFGRNRISHSRPCRRRGGGEPFNDSKVAVRSPPENFNQFVVLYYVSCDQPDLSRENGYFAMTGPNSGQSVSPSITSSPTVVTLWMWRRFSSSGSRDGHSVLT